MFQDETGFGRINNPKYCWCSKGYDQAYLVNISGNIATPMVLYRRWQEKASLWLCLTVTQNAWMYSWMNDQSSSRMMKSCWSAMERPGISRKQWLSRKTSLCWVFPLYSWNESHRTDLAWVENAGIQEWSVSYIGKGCWPPLSDNQQPYP